MSGRGPGASGTLGGMKQSTAMTACAAAVMGLVGCASNETTVTLRVLSQPENGAATPEAYAHVRLIRLNTSSVPLPITKETMKDLKPQPPLFALTDEAGVAHLRLRKESAHLVEVQWPVFSGRADDVGFRGVLLADGRIATTGEASTSAASNGMRVDVVR